jgi:hypothetical protein
MAGLEGGEQVRRNFDTYLTHPAQHRNECWEAGHVRHEAPFTERR